MIELVINKLLRKICYLKNKKYLYNKNILNY
jgi:hypothetical protein